MSSGCDGAHTALPLTAFITMSLGAESSTWVSLMAVRCLCPARSAAHSSSPLSARSASTCSPSEGRQMTLPLVTTIGLGGYVSVGCPDRTIRPFSSRIWLRLLSYW
jgi:hypothetical protein